MGVRARKPGRARRLCATAIGMSENENRGLRVVIVVSLVVIAIASAVLAGYIASQQPASLAKTLRKKVMADHADYERTAQTAIKVARVRQGELKLDDLPSSDRWMASDAKVDGIMTSVPLPGRARSMSGTGTADVEFHGSLGYVVRFSLSTGILGEAVDLVYAPGWAASEVEDEVGDPYPVMSGWFLVYST